jgi:nucleoid DNA-binding protein
LGDACDRFSVAMPGGRRLHVLAGPRVRFGRGPESDVLLAAFARDNPAGTLAVTREISRKHCEIALEADRALVRDGWLEGEGVSKFGTFVDGSRASREGVELRTGQEIKLTSHPPSRVIPRWKAIVVERAALRGMPPAMAEAAAGGERLMAVLLQRLDDVPDDILLVPRGCDLRALGLTERVSWLWHHAGRFRASHGGGSGGLAVLAGAIPGCEPGPPGKLAVHTVEELIRKAGAKGA